MYRFAHALMLMSLTTVRWRTTTARGDPLPAQLVAKAMETELRRASDVKTLLPKGKKTEPCSIPLYNIDVSHIVPHKCFSEDIEPLEVYSVRIQSQGPDYRFDYYRFLVIRFLTNRSTIHPYNRCFVTYSLGTWTCYNKECKEASQGRSRCSGAPLECIHIKTAIEFKQKPSGPANLELMMEMDAFLLVYSRTCRFLPVYLLNLKLLQSMAN